jgi:hypothetical protein
MPRLLRQNPGQSPGAMALPSISFIDRCHFDSSHRCDAATVAAPHANAGSPTICTADATAAPDLGRGLEWSQIPDGCRANWIPRRATPSAPGIDPGSPILARESLRAFIDGRQRLDPAICISRTAAGSPIGIRPGRRSATRPGWTQSACLQSSNRGDRQVRGGVRFPRYFRAQRKTPQPRLRGFG